VRTALISDIHGNAVALDAVLADARRRSVDAVVCLGDLATLGPQPADVLDRLAERRVPCIMGNHDAALLDPARARAYRIAPALIDSLHWCAARLARHHRAFLRACLPLLRMPLGESGEMLCFHGSPRSNVETISAATPGIGLDRLLRGSDADVLAGGHSHFPLLRMHRGRYVINPGSVGAAFLTPACGRKPPTLLPWAQYAVVESGRRSLGVVFRRVAFDLAAFLRAVDISDLPPAVQTWWRGQYDGRD
jgi:putative phosphoesterase